MKKLKFIKFSSLIGSFFGLSILSTSLAINSLSNNYLIGNNEQKIITNKAIDNVVNNVITNASAPASVFIEGDGIVRGTIWYSTDEQNELIIVSSSNVIVKDPTFVSSINIENNNYTLTTINRQAFGYQTSPHGLSGILSIPNSIFSIGQYAFMSQPITSVNINDNRYFSIVDVNTNGHLLLDSGKTEWDFLEPPIGCLAWGDFDLSGVQNKTTKLNWSWCDLYGCGGITSLKIPEGIESIENEIFAFCTNLHSITLPDSLSSIYTSTGKGSIGAFGFDPITQVNINEDNPNFHLVGVKENEGYVLLDKSASSWDYETAPRGCIMYGIIDMSDYQKNEFPNLLYGCGGVTKMVLSQNIKLIGSSIGFGGLAGYVQLQEINTNYLTSISGAQVFGGFGLDINLKHIDLSNIIELERGVFNSCYSLESITFPDTLENIESKAFNACINMTGTLNIPKATTLIGANAFNDTSYNEVHLNWTKDQNLSLDENWLGNLNNQNTKVYIPIDQYQFYYDHKKDLGIDQCKIAVEGDISVSSWIEGCEKGTINVKLNYDNMLSVLSVSDDIYATNPIITSKIKTDSNAEFEVHEIGDNLFNNKVNFKGVVSIGSGINIIGSNVFEGCNNITGLSLNWDVNQVNQIIRDKSISTDWLLYLNATGFKIYVPKGAYSVYEKYKDQLGINNCTIISQDSNSKNNLALILGISLGLGIPILVGGIIGIIIITKKHKLKNTKKSKKKTK